MPSRIIPIQSSADLGLTPNTPFPPNTCSTDWNVDAAAARLAMMNNPYCHLAFSLAIFGRYGKGLMPGCQVYDVLVPTHGPDPTADGRGNQRLGVSTGATVRPSTPLRATESARNPLARSSSSAAFTSCNRSVWSSGTAIACGTP